MAKNILRPKESTYDYLYPAGYIAATNPNVFESKGLSSANDLTSPQIKIHFIFTSQGLQTQAVISKPAIAFKFIAYSQNLQSSQKLATTRLFTNPVIWLSKNTQSPSNLQQASLNRYPDWYKPHKNQIGTGIPFRQGYKQQRHNLLTNKQAHRQDEKRVFEWVKARDLMPSRQLGWVEKRRVDAKTEIPFVELKQVDKLLGLINQLLTNRDIGYNLLISLLHKKTKGVLCPAHQPPAKDELMQALWNVFDKWTVKNWLNLGRPVVADRVHFRIVWGIGGLGCKQRYVPPLGNDTDFDMEQIKTGLLVEL